MNQCPFLTVKAVEIASQNQTLEILGINHLEAPLPQVLEIICGNGADNSDPLPKLKELHMESSSWQDHLDEYKSFLTRRRHLSQLRVWAIKPNLDFRDHPDVGGFFQALLSHCPVHKILLTEAQLNLIQMASHLRVLQLQKRDVSQQDADVLAKACPFLRSLSISSSKFSKAKGIHFDKLNALEELTLLDANLGLVASLPRNLSSLSVSSSTIDATAWTFLIASIMKLPSLRKLQLLTAFGDLGKGSLSESAISSLIRSLASLEDLIIDRDLLSPRIASSSNVVISHQALKHIKIISTFSDRPNVQIVQAPNLLSFDATHYLDFKVSSDVICNQCPLLQTLRVRFENRPFGMSPSSSPLVSQLAQKRSKSTPRTLGVIQHTLSTQSTTPPQLDTLACRAVSALPARILQFAAKMNFCEPFKVSPRSMRIDSLSLESPRDSVSPRSRSLAPSSRPDLTPTGDSASLKLSKLDLLAEISLDSPPESFLAQLPSLKFLNSLKMANCSLPYNLIRKLSSEFPSLRELELARCRGLFSLSQIEGCPVSRLTVRSCNDLYGPIKVTGSAFPNVEVLSISSINYASSLLVSGLQHIRSVKITNVDLSGVISVSDVPRLHELILENIPSNTIHVVAPQMRRFYLDCYGADADLSGGELSPSLLSMQLVAPMLERFTWSCNDVSLHIPLTLVSKSPKLKSLEMPDTYMDVVEPIAAKFKDFCPNLDRICCGDGDLAIV